MKIDGFEVDRRLAPSCYNIGPYMRPHFEFSNLAGRKIVEATD